ncbi:MAG: twin-arginine translocase TatA/TatE family subunit [Campylobacterales bacterium]
MVSGWQILVILVIILLLFGGRKIPELAKGLGEGIRSFKKAVAEEEQSQKGEVIDAEVESPAKKGAQQANSQPPITPTQEKKA